MIRDSINSAITTLHASIQEHKNDVIADVAKFDSSLGMEAPIRVGKAGMRDLFGFLYSAEAKSLKARQKPIALTFSIGGGINYNADAILVYIRELEQAFERQVLYCLVNDKHGNFVSLISTKQFKTALGDPTSKDAIMGVLNSTGDDLKTFKFKFSDVFGPLHEVHFDSTIFDALSEPVWPDPTKTDEQLPVCDATGKFLGITSRGRLIEGILASL